MGKKTQIKEEENGDINAEEMETSAKGGKKGKKSKKKDYDEDDVAKELEDLNLEVNGEAPKPKPASEQQADKEEQDGSKNEKSKKEKKKKKKRGDDDEDLDDLLAEIESEYTGVKVVKKENKEKLAEENKEKLPEENEKEKSDSVDRSSRDSSTKGDGKTQQKGKAETKNKKSEEKAPQGESKKNGKKSVKEDSPSLEEDDSSKKKKKGKAAKEDVKKKEEEDKSRKGKPNKKMLEAMKAMLAKQKEDEERQIKEMEEKERQEEERVRQILEQRRLEEERKERIKQKQKERLKRLKEEGKLLTNKQRFEAQRAKAMLEHLKAQGVVIPEVGEKLPTAHVSYKRQKRKKQEVTEEKPEEGKPVEESEEKEEEGDEEEVAEAEEEEDVVDAWDQISESEDDENEKQEDDAEDRDSGKDISTVKDGDDSDDDGSEAEEKHTEAEKRREKAVQRMTQRKSDNEKIKSEERLRAPVVCVLGHVDHGKTKILDKLRRTNVQEGEVGGITQQIGATNVPFEAVKSQTRMVKDFEVNSVRLPGLLIIDTPGHESFSNLRTRGSSLCDIAILVVDITQGLEPQTIESINLLKNKKTPFIVALNKVDRVFEWESHPSKDIRDIIKLQNDPCKNDFDRRTAEVIQALNMQGLNAALFWENPDPRSYVSLVPTSAISGDGMGNLISLITTMCQKRLSQRLMFSEELQCTVLEVKTIQGHGTTIDVILINGRLREGDTIILAGTEGPIVTQIRSLLIPKPMKEIRVKGQYDELKMVEAALGVKLAAKELEKAIAGLNLQVAQHEDEVDILKEEVDRELKAAMRSIKVKDKGVYVQASTLGALEALLEFFKTNKVPYAGIRVGPVVKKDVMKAAAMLEHDPMYAVILAFDVKVERDAQELADKEGVKIFSEETIYHLGDRYVEYIKDYKKKKQDEFRHISVFPCKLKILPDAIFNKRDPIVLGVTVDSGILRTGTPLCVPMKEFVEIGVVTSLEFDHKVVEIAKKGVNVCMKVEPLPGHTPKLFGRHFDADDILVSKITRESIDACKQYFRDDLGKNEWKLMADLKKQFNIL